MSCINVTLYCDWCKKVPVGSNHCCESYGHGILCEACRETLAKANLRHDRSFLDDPPPKPPEK